MNDTATKQKNEKATKLERDLRHFSGSCEFVRHPLNRQVVMSEGVMHLMKEAEAYWLGDVIATYFGTALMKRQIASDDRLATLQFWNLTVQDGKGLLEARADAGVTPFITQVIGYTDFP